MHVNITRTPFFGKRYCVWQFKVYPEYNAQPIFESIIVSYRQYCSATTDHCQTLGAFGWYDLEQDRTAGAHGAASCQPNGTPETEHIFVKNMPNLVHSSIYVYGHHGHCVRYDESNPKAYARDHLGPKSMFPPGFTVKK